jgi:hypothetical protein
MRTVTIACLSMFAFAGCAFDESELVSDGDTAIADAVVEQESAPVEEELAGTEAGEADGVVASQSTEEELAAETKRRVVGDGACHTFDYLRAWSDYDCSLSGNPASRAVARNYTHGCTGWWGAGARYVWFDCGVWSVR